MMLNDPWLVSIINIATIAMIVLIVVDVLIATML